MKKLIEFTCCKECYFTKECNGDLCGLNRKNVDTFKHYANKVQIEALIEEAERRHREKGGLVVCDHAEEKCKYEKTCGDATRLPHVYSENDDYLSWECNGRKCKRIAFRGEQTKEEDGQKYVVVKEFNLEILSGTSIEPKYFLTIFRLWHFKDHKTDFKVGDILPEHLTVCFEELERLNFIEKVVHDPVVSKGDCFKRSDGLLFKYFKIGGSLGVLACLDDEYDGYESYKINNKSKLSDLVGINNIKAFKPVKIKTTEVEEG